MGLGQGGGRWDRWGGLGQQEEEHSPEQKNQAMGQKWAEPGCHRESSGGTVALGGRVDLVAWDLLAHTPSGSSHSQ